MKKTLLALLIVCAAFNTLQAVTYYVTTSGNDANAGTAWGTAYRTVQKALSVATSGDQIWVAAGTYYPDEIDATNSNDRASTFQLKNGVALYGGFAGGETMLSQRNVTANVTILSGDLTQNDGANFANNGENAIHVVTGSGTNNTALLDGFTITAGNANMPSFLNNAGGGMLNDNGSPTIANCTFSGNSAGSGGGGMLNDLSSPILTNCTFSGNSAANGGGMINDNNSSPTVSNCAFSGNRAIDGGGMCNFNNSSPTITNCAFSGNSASFGGGMYNDSSSPIVSNCTFSGNSATNSFNGGGGMYNDLGSPSLSNCIIWNNRANGVTTSTSASIFNLTFTPTIAYSVIANSGGSGSWNNALGADGGNNKDVDPRFMDADGADNTVGTLDDDLRLQPSSPAINMGNNAADLDGAGPGTTTIADIATDLGGNPRIQLGQVDMGAYETQCSDYTFTNQIAYVDATPSGSGNNGSDWANAFKDVQSALTVACNCPDKIKEIWVAAGTYYPDEGIGKTDNDRSNTFQLCNNVKLYGGFSGTETLLSQRNVTANVTILSGDLDKNDGANFANNGNNAYHVVTGSGTNNTALLDGFTITAGNANGGGNNSYGGGMYNFTGSPTVANCTFSGNTASNGGGMCNDSGSPTITDCTFSGNSGGNGGGMYNLSSSSIVINCTFSGNTANSGGGMFNQVGSPHLTNCAFSGNRASNGGGMCNQLSSPTVTNCTFSGNRASVEGGGMSNFIGSSPSISNCIIWNNQSNSFTNTTSASIFNSSSTPAIAYSLIANSGGSSSWQSALGTDGGNNKDVDPQFVDADGADNTVGTLDDDLRLLPSSPAINMGDNNAVTVPPFLADAMGDAIDLDGNKRIVASTVDMGAYESACPTISAEIAGTTTICPSGNTNLSVTITGGAAPYTLVYSPDGGNTEVTVNNYQSGANIAVMPGASTTYTLIAVTDANGCPATSLNGNATVTVNPLPTASVSAATSPICAGENAVFNLIGTANAEVTYNINNGSNQTVNLDGNGTATVTVNNATADQTLNLVSVKNTSTNCVQNLNGNATVMVNQPATIEAGTAQTICQTKTVGLTSIGASIGGGASAGVWSTSGDGIFTGGTAFGSATAYVPGTNDKKSGTVVLTLSTTDAGVCPNVADQVVIKILKVDCGAFPWNGN